MSQDGAELVQSGSAPLGNPILEVKIL